MSRWICGPAGVSKQPHPGGSPPARAATSRLRFPTLRHAVISGHRGCSRFTSLKMGRRGTSTTDKNCSHSTTSQQRCRPQPSTQSKAPCVSRHGAYRPCEPALLSMLPARQQARRACASTNPTISGESKPLHTRTASLFSDSAARSHAWLPAGAPRSSSRCCTQCITVRERWRCGLSH